MKICFMLLSNYYLTSSSLYFSLSLSLCVRVCLTNSFTHTHTHTHTYIHTHTHTHPHTHTNMHAHTHTHTHTHPHLLFCIPLFLPTLTQLSILYIRTCYVPQVNYTGPELSINATAPLTQVPVELRDGVNVVDYVILFNELFLSFICMLVCFCPYMHLCYFSLMLYCTQLFFINYTIIW